MGDLSRTVLSKRDKNLHEREKKQEYMGRKGRKTWVKHTSKDEQRGRVKEKHDRTQDKHTMKGGRDVFRDGFWVVKSTLKRAADAQSYEEEKTRLGK